MKVPPVTADHQVQPHSGEAQARLAGHGSPVQALAGRGALGSPHRYATETAYTAVSVTPVRSSVIDADGGGREINW